MSRKISIEAALLFVVLLCCSWVNSARAEGGWCTASNHAGWVILGEGCGSAARDYAKSRWDAQYPSFVHCRVWTEDVITDPDAFGADVLRYRAFLDGCAGGGVNGKQYTCPAGTTPTTTGTKQCVTTPTCPAGQFWNYETGACEEEGGEPPPDPEECSANKPVSAYFDNEPQGCVNGCYVDWGVGATGDGIPGGWYKGSQTGAECSTPNPPDFEPMHDDPEGPPEICAENENGDSLCWPRDWPENCGEVEGEWVCENEPEGKNCGEINGKKICLDDAPKGSCQYMPGGSYVCATEPNEDPPQSPDNGDEEDPQDEPPDWQLKGEDKWLDIWGEGTVEGSTNPPSPFQGNETLTSERLEGVAREATLDSIRRDIANGVKLDEEGTPEDAGGMFEGALQELDEEVGTVDEGGTFDVVELPSMLPSSGGCQSISGSFLSHDFTIPGSDGCDKMVALKEIIGWAFGIYTVLHIFFLAIRRPE